MHWIKKILWGLLVLLTLLVAIYHELVFYGLAQAKGQLNIVWRARPVEHYLADPLFPDSLKQKLKLIQEVRKYAIDSLGLRNTKNYTTLFDQQGKDVLWVVTASKEFALEPKEWTFPILGSVPYKGFFEENRAKSLADKLRDEGWDADVRVPGGWSTLGWFKDPILSKMLLRAEGDLASLIIHEMVHATIFVKDSVDFNENLASFIGDAGALKFLAYRFGVQSREYRQFITEEEDYQKFIDHMLRGADSLKAIYESFPEGMLYDDKVRKKQEAIERIVIGLDSLTLSLKFQPSTIFKNRPPNNAYFMSFMRYQSLVDDFQTELENSFNNDLPAFIDYYRKTYPYLKD